MIARYTRANISKSKIEIGVSKACCEWCREYLNLLALEYKQHKILVRATHGKQPDGWMIPPNGPEPVARRMRKFIADKVHDIVWEIESRRRSDSNELPDLPVEMAEMEVEMKGIDFGSVKQLMTGNVIDFGKYLERDV
jgi:OTT_1508-like deaminase